MATATQKPAGSRNPRGATPSLGYWIPDPTIGGPDLGEAALRKALLSLREPICIVEHAGHLAAGRGGSTYLGPEPVGGEAHPVLGYVPALTGEQLGDATFRETHGVRYAYVGGEMAHGIASEEMVEALAAAGMIGFFGAAGCSPQRVEKAITRIKQNVAGKPFGFNLIHSPGETGMEDTIIDLYLKHEVRTVCASAFMDLTLPTVRYRVSGIHATPSGEIVTPNHLFCKISRVEVASKFFSPPPAEMLAALVQQGVITQEQAKLAERIPVAEDMTAEADSGGHTDNRPLVTLLPSMVALRDQMMARHGYARPLRVGAAGGIATPTGVAGAFAMGASYVLTGSVNQACVESGTSDEVRKMLADASQVDIIMGPAADMFEMGVNVQVLKRGTMFAMRGRKLYELYKAHERIEDLPAKERAQLEKDFFRKPLEEIWAETAEFFKQRDPRQIELADQSPKHKMALIFRWYLGRSSKWANIGDASRKLDYQVWCGPAMGAFNEWTRGSHFEKVENRKVGDVGLNLMLGAAYLTRIAWLHHQGLRLIPALESFPPRPPKELAHMLAS